MKPMIIFLISACMLLVMTACASQTATMTSADATVSVSNDSSSDETASVSNASSIDESTSLKDDKTGESGDSKILVAYFSCTGTTEKIAGWIAEQTGADLYEIIPESPYTSEDLNYGDSSSRTTQEQNNPEARPVISGESADIDRYDIIFLGYPIWHGQAPRIISSFLESYDFSGKTIVPFCTSHSSGAGSSAVDLQSLCSPSVTWLPCERFSADTSTETIEEWIEVNGYARGNR